MRFKAADAELIRDNILRNANRSLPLSLPLSQSLTQPKAYIVTQGPTETSIGDFWRMVWQEKASCIVMVTRDATRLKAATQRLVIFWKMANYGVRPSES